jgi:transcriptional regulator with XRE-family HTH domain
MELGDRISAWRRARGLTQLDLAKAADVTVSAVCMWEGGKASPLQKHLSVIVELFDVTMEEFYGGPPAAPKSARVPSKAKRARAS